MRANVGSLHAVASGRWGAFTMVELLVVMGVIALLLSILLPSLSAARRQARAVACRSNLRELAVANGSYADESGGVYVPGAAEFLRNLNRWHGERKSAGEAFDPRRGPLAVHLGPDGGVRQCPTFPADEIARESGGFERGNGGYGYNNAFVGVQLAKVGASAYEVMNDAAGAYTSDVRRPAETIMFTDAAFAIAISRRIEDRVISRVIATLIEYSFSEPRFHPAYPASRTDPSIHFRHGGFANVAWCDGHVDAHRRAFSRKSFIYDVDPERFGIGWFGKSDDNSLFDLK